MSSKDADQLVELTSFPNELEAQLLVSRLESAGIAATAFESALQVMGYLCPTQAPGGGVQVQVRRGDLDRARVIAGEFEAEGADMDAFDDGEDDAG